MANLKFADTHNMVAFLSKPVEQIVDFLNAHTIKYALTVNPTIYTSCIEQFWATVKAKTVNREVQLQALVDGKKIIITESIVRRDLQLEDSEGVDLLFETDKMIHTVETDIVKLVVEIEGFDMSFDEFDKETGSSDGLQPKQVDLSCVHALNKLHLHEIRVLSQMFMLLSSSENLK
ncbi:hypothetical protein Tco_0320474 [Tanacetum coccineum]